MFVTGKIRHLLSISAGVLTRFFKKFVKILHIFRHAVKPLRHDQTRNAMKICPVSNLPVTEKKHWNIAHPNNDYSTKFSLIGTDIILTEHITPHDITLDYISSEVFMGLLKELDFTRKPLYMIVDLTHVTGVEFNYKKDFTNFIYNWGPNFKQLVMFSIRQEIRTLVESFISLAPQSMACSLVDTYEDAVRAVMNYKAGRQNESGQTEVDEKSAWNLFLKNEFLSAIARMTWLNMLDQHIYTPPADDSMYPFFKAIKHLQGDLKAREMDHDRQMQQLTRDFENRITQKIIKLNAQIELNKKTSQQFEQEKSSLLSRIAAQETELTRISTAISEKTEVLHFLCSKIQEVPIEAPLKRQMTELCRNLIETEKKEKRLKTELTTADSAFLSKLQKKHPNLNQRELRISLLVKLDYDTQEISRAIGLSTRGIESVRYRMHKKLGLDKHKSIKTYLTDLASELLVQ